MIKVLVDKKEICDYIIDFENGISCSYVITNGILTSYNFYNDQFKRLIYVTDETLEKLVTIHWQKHYDSIDRNIIKSEIELETFTMFNNLYYVGGSMDGMLFKYDGTPISTPFYLDCVYFQCYEGLETTKENCQLVLDSFNKDLVLESEIVEIPSYNQSDDDDDYEYDGHFTLSLLVKLPDDVYIDILGKSKHWSTDENKKTIDILKLC